MILRARVVLPLSQAPIENGAVTIAGNRIVAVGRWKSPPVSKRAEVVDLGDAILLPGLVNAHCHLDYTDMAGKLPPPKCFADWIRALIDLKAHWDDADYARSWRKGAALLLRSGTTTVADIESVPALIPRMWTETPLRVISFRELISLKDQPPPRDKVIAAVKEWSALPDADHRVGLSPHAPYSTTPALLRQAALSARQARWRLTTHVAESEEEFQLFMYRHGPMYEWLKRQRRMADCGLGSPVKHLERCGYLGGNLLAVHVNYLARGDDATLARHHVSVAHCPRSHAYFQHRDFPWDKLRGAGVAICLGTDSLASVLKTRGQLPELDLFAEMSTLAAAKPDIPPLAIVKMATVNAARALGMGGEIGVISKNSRADLITLPFTGRATAASEAVVHHSGPVRASMIDGRWAIPPKP